MYDTGSAYYPPDKRQDRYGYGDEYVDYEYPAPAYDSVSRHSPRISYSQPRSQSAGRQLTHKTRPRSGTAAEYYSNGALEPYYHESSRSPKHYHESSRSPKSYHESSKSPKPRGRSSTFRDFIKGFTDDHSSRERERDRDHERRRSHRSGSGSSGEHDFAATMMGGAVGGLAGRKFGHTMSGAVVGAIAANLAEHELNKSKEHHKHRHHHHSHRPHHHHHERHYDDDDRDYYYGEKSHPHRHHHHSHHEPGRHSHSHSTHRHMSPDESAKYGYAWGYDDEEYKRAKKERRHRSLSDALRKEHSSYSKYPAVKY